MFRSEICLVRISCDDPKGRVSLISFKPLIKFGVLYWNIETDLLNIFNNYFGSLLGSVAFLFGSSVYIYWWT